MTNDTKEAEQAWRADVIQHAKENNISRADLGRDILLSIASEIGAWKVLGIVAVFLLATIGSAFYGAVKILQRGQTNKSS